MKIRKTKGKKHRHMMQGLLSIIDGLIRLLTFGFFWSNLEYVYVASLINHIPKFNEVQLPKHSDYIPKRSVLKRRTLSYHSDTGKIYDRGIEVGSADLADGNELIGVKFKEDNLNDYIINNYKIMK